MTRWLTFLLLLFTAAALFGRMQLLSHRPMHNDEAVNAVKFAALWQTGSYKYDPNEHHGPSLYYATWLFNKVTAGPAIDRFSESRLRIVPALFGIGLMLLLPLVVDGLGRRGFAWAAVFTAASPALIFYSNYFIHEAILVFATFLTLGAGWRYWRSRQLVWALLAGAGLGLMHATKETFVLTVAAAALALFLNHTWNRVFDASAPPVKAPPLNWSHLAFAGFAWLIVFLLLFTSFFTNLRGIYDSIATYLPWTERAAGASPHIHPWTFYLHRLSFFHPPKSPLWTEGLILVLAGIGAYAGFARQKLGRANASFVRFLALYGFLLGSFYSLIAYKTPWCLFSFWHAAVLLAGVGAAVLLRYLRPVATRVAVGALIGAGVVHLCWQAWMQGTEYAADRRNPYVYAQTSPHIVDLAKRVAALSLAHQDQQNLLIKVVSPDGDYWPLPWYLRQFPRIGWWEALPPDPFAPVMIVSSRLDARLDEKQTHLMVGYYQLRPEVFLELYVDIELWKRYLAQNPPSRSDD